MARSSFSVRAWLFLRPQPELNQAGGWPLGGNPGHTSSILPNTYFAARPTSQEMHPTAAKYIIAIQAFESESLPVMIAAKMVSAAI
jgi:hypothetical protein